MIATSHRIISGLYRLAEAAIILLLLIGELFRRRPRPSDAPLVSGIAPGDGGKERPLSETQLRQLEAWLRLHQKGWTRNIIPPFNTSYMVQVEHSDSTTTFVYLFSSIRSAIYFSKFNAGRFDARWLHPPAAEVEGLIAMLREE